MSEEKIEAEKEFEKLKGENKFSKKAKQIHDKLISAVQSRITKYTTKVDEALKLQTKVLADNLDGNIKTLNDQIAAFEKKMHDKYGNLYSHLIKVFLVNLESRVFSSEIFTQAHLEMMMKGFYRIKYNVEEVDEDSEQWKDFVKAGAKEHALIQNVMAKNYAEEKKKEVVEKEKSEVKSDVESGKTPEGQKETETKEQQPAV